MLVNMNEVLYPAKEGKYGVGLFNAVNLELARGIIEAAEETKSPVIFGTAEVLFPYGPLQAISNMLLDMAEEALSGQELADFVKDLRAAMENSLTKMEKDLEGFTLKFDYRNADKPWGNSRDALPRTVLKLRGKE